MHLTLHLAPSPLRAKDFGLLPTMDLVAFDWILLLWMVMHSNHGQKAERRLPQARARGTVPTR